MKKKSLMMCSYLSSFKNCITMDQQNIPLMSIEEAAAETQRFMTNVYGWMSFALIITGFVAMYTASSPALLQIVFGSTFTLLGIIVLEFIMVGTLAGWSAECPLPLLR